MKRIVALALILIMLLAVLTGCGKSQETEGPPWPAIGVRSMAQLNEMREMVSCADEEKLNEYLRSVEGGGARTREDLVAFLNLIDYLPVLELLKGDITWINHGKDIAGNESVVISTQGENGDWTRVEYLAWGNGVNDEIEFRKDNGYFENSVIDTPIYFCDGRIAVYSEIRDAHPSGNGYTVTWTIVVNGILANVVYYSEEIDDISAESVFADVTIGTLKTKRPADNNIDITMFSYADDVATYTKGSPGVKHTGFKNTTEHHVSCGTQALERAKNECTVEYNHTHVYYDEEANVWMVLFYKRNTLGGGQSVYMDADGKTLMIVYGE